MPVILHILVYNAQGEPDDCDLLDSIYTADMEGEPFWSEFRVIGPGHLICHPGRPEPFQLHVFWEITSFGRVYAVADHSGQGYLAGRDREITLNDELAASRVARTKRRLLALEAAYSFAPALRARIEEADALLSQASMQTSWKGCVDLLQQAHSSASWALEEIEVTKARQDVQHLSAERRKGFRFGCNPFAFKRSPAFREHFTQLWDFGIVPFYREMVEPKERHYDWRVMDETLTWLQASGLTAKGHPLFWGHEEATPFWMKRLNRAALWETVRRQVMETVHRYKDRIKIWDVINEAHDWPPANVFGLQSQEQLELTTLIARSVHEVDQEAVRVFNCCVLWGEYVAWSEATRPMSPYRYLHLLQEQGLTFEAIGLQLYYPDRDLADISLLLDKFAALGKPIHITELGTPSGERIRKQLMHPIEEEWGAHHARVPGWWHGPWNQTLQADWIEQFYLIALSKPNVEAISWWDFSDACCIYPFTGLLDSQDQPKEAFFRLQQLISHIRQD